MQKTIEINGKEYTFKASAATPIMYRMKFNGDLFAEISKLSATADDFNAGIIPPDSLDVFSKVAYIMAIQADKAMKLEFVEWLDQFEMFDIIEIMPDIIELWNTNQLSIAEAKKNTAV